MREVKFRGISQHDHGWVYGFYIERDGYDKGMIYDRRGLGIDVDPKTVGQCLEFRDKNEKEIFEGDSIIVTDEHGNTDQGTVGYVPKRMAYCIIWHEGESSYNLSDTEQSEIEVIGNIYENKELLNG